MIYFALGSKILTLGFVTGRI